VLLVVKAESLKDKIDPVVAVELRVSPAKLGVAVELIS